MNKIDTLLITCILLIGWLLFVYILVELSNINSRIDKIEKQELEVHEYILNKIGG